jgi:SpoVK/Ycf46/Vps4 family AAA+-type ATPase
MKKQTHRSQKFQKKYFFFQKSFFDFLDWRSTQKAKPHFLTESQLTSSSIDFPAFSKGEKFEKQREIQMNFDSVQKFYPFEQEKMSFYKYWKREDSFTGNDKNRQNMLKSSTKAKSFESQSLEFSQKNKEKKSFSFLKKKKTMKSFSYSKKSFNFLTNQKFHFLFLKKRKEKTTHFQKKILKNESFLPITSSFEISQNLELNALWTKSQKIGDFFPKKKNFIQYWIFPFLGVLFFFSQNISFLFLQREKKSENSFLFEPFQVLDPTISQDFFSKPSFLNFQTHDHKGIQPFEYSFAQKNLTKTKFFQNLEKTEYEDFLKFYNEIFQNTLFDSFSNTNLKNSIYLSPFAKSARLHFLQPQFQKKLVALSDSKRNCLNWKWFSLNSNLFNSQLLMPVSLQIPQKAKFFAMNCCSDSLHLIEKKRTLNREKPLTPMFEYSKNLFLIDELKRNFHLLQYGSTEPPFFSDSPMSQTDKKFSFPLEKNSFSFLKTSEMKNFFQNQVSFDLNKKEKIFEKNFHLFLKNSHKMNTIPSMLSSADDQNKYFLNKWIKTQKFSILHKSNKKKASTNLSNQTFDSFFRFQKRMLHVDNEKLSLRKDIKKTKNTTISNQLMNLDALYFQKVFEKFNTQNFEKQSSSQSFQNQQKQFSGKKKFFNFKKQTYGFFIFQHYNKNYKKFLNSFLLNGFQSKKIRTHFSVPLPIHSQNKKGLSLNQTSSFVNTKGFGQKNYKAFENIETIVLQSNISATSQVERLNLYDSSTVDKLNSPILFQFLQNPQFKISPLFDQEKFGKSSLFSTILGIDNKNQTIEFQTYSDGNKTLYPENFYGQRLNFSFFPQFQKNNNFSFHFFSKLEGFSLFKIGSLSESVSENNFWKKTFKNFFSKVYTFQNFEKNFLFETKQHQKPLLFQKDFNFSSENLKNRKKDIPFGTYTKKLQKNKKFLMSSSFYILKSKERLPFFQYKNENKNSVFTFSGLSKKHRKFEKTFQAFFSPLKETKNFFSLGTMLPNSLQNSEKKEKKQIFMNPRGQQVLMTEGIKTSKNVLLLQSLSDILKKSPKNFSYSFYFPTTFKSLKRKENGNQKMKKEFQKSHLSPQLVLKRDGFLSLSSQNSFFYDVDQQKSKGNKNFTLQRLEKEKSFQKKRRLKKEKLETRRRKKRKRFFPRPVWLRMNLYKKFLKTRHSQKILSFSSKIKKQKTFPSKEKKNKFHFVFFLENRKNLFPMSSPFLTKNKKEKWFKKTEQKQLNRYFVKKFCFLNKTKQINTPYGKKISLLKQCSDFQNYDVDSVFLKKQNSNFQMKTYQKNSSKEENSLFSFTKKSGIDDFSKNIEHYKISNEIYQEFLRLSWKSSWFQNNFKPYTQTIQKSFQKIQTIESQKNLSNFFDILKSKNFSFFFRDFPIFSEKSENDFLVRKSVLQKFSWYSNVQNSFTSHSGSNSFTREGFPPEIEKKNTGRFLRTETRFKISEYNRILSARISEILKKMKFSENMTNDSFFESLKGKRRKTEKIFSGSKDSFFTKTALFLEKFQVPSQPTIPAFSVFSSLFNDFSIKPSGNVPTLRAMWAYQKTNFSHFQERNAIQNLWAFKKRKDALNSFKSTKKFMNFLKKYNGFEKLKTPKQFSSDWSLFVIPKSKKTMNTILYNSSFNIFPKRTKNNTSRETIPNLKKTINKNFFLASKKGEFLTHSVSEKGNHFFNQLDSITLQKFQNVEKKSSVFGIQAFKQNSKISYRYFKYHLSPFSKTTVQDQKKLAFVSHFDIHQQSGAVVENEISTLFSQKLLKNKNPQNSAKSSLNFWWAQKPFQNFDFLGSSQFQIFSNFSNSKTFGGELKNHFFFNKDSGVVPKNQIFESQKTTFSLEEQFFFSNISFFIFGAFFFHFAIFYTLFKIPEIRSVFKFTLLIFSKFWNSFFIVFFSIYNIFKRYTQNGFNLLTSSSSFSKNRKMENENKQLLSFDQKGFFSEKEFFNFLFHMPLSKTSFFFFPTKSKYEIKNGKKTKFDDFVFAFFPRFSSFSLGMEIFHSRSDKFTKKKKPFYQFPGRDGLFKNFETQKRNFRAIFSKTKTLKNFDSVLVFQISEKHTFLKKNLFSNFSLAHDLEQLKPTFFVPLTHTSLGYPTKFTKTEKNLSQVALSVLVFGKQFLFIPYHIFKLGSSISTKIFEIIEGIFYAFYKFLEKPAEFMIEFIAFVFLIEWSSDILGFFPDSIESSVWKSSQKLLRPVRTGTFFLSFGVFLFGTSVKSLSKGSSLTFQTNQNFSIFSPFQFFLSTGYFQFSNFAAYVLQKRLLYALENVPSIFLQPDIDILVRQRKGIIFWDIWAEILLKAAEKYNVNLPSFVTLKEEQELFIEKLVHDSEFFKTFSHSTLSGVESSRLFSTTNEEKSSKSFSAFYRSADQNFVLQNRPLNLYDFSFLSQGESSFYSSLFKKSKNPTKLQQLSISNLFSSGTSLPSQQFKNKIENEVANFFSFSQNSFHQTKLSKSFIQKEEKNRKLKTFFPLFLSQSQNLHFLQNSSKNSEEFSIEDSFSLFQNMKKMDRWQCNQYSTFQSQETDFFLDIYPPKSLKHVHFLKYYEPAQYTLGSFICQIYAGIFSKQISKNILVVGESGTAKTFFLRALAGETEMKIITENASRYAIVQRGVAVGMKYLRDVFDAIALQTPCFFVMEDLHIIGAKRPMMISENENTQNIQSSFGLEQQEVHETNQMIYQSSRHSVSDFRRPYKGDFSMGIATNSFLQTFYSSFFPTAGGEKNSASSQGKNFSQYSHDSFFYPLQKGHQYQNSQFFGGNFSSSVWNSLSSPLPIDSLEAVFQNTGIQEKEKSNFESFSNKKNVKKIQSILQFSKEQIFAPPATSPFAVLMMKEQKKLKPKKIVQETSWGGLSADQILLYQKESSSIRAKIAALAEKTMNLSRGKFDMITDFLVIIDSVRSNRGFVVFGTTHKPSALDPALRRPGRFDETLSLSRTPNFLNRFEIFKMNFENSVSTFDFFDASIFTENFSEMDLFDILSQTKLSFFHNYKYDAQKFLPQSTFLSEFKKSDSQRIKKFGSASLSFSNADNFLVKNQVYSQISPKKAFHNLLKSPVFEDFYTQKQFTGFSMQNTSKSNIFTEKLRFSLRNSNFFFNQSYTVLPKGPSHLLSLAYSKLGIFLAEANLFRSSQVHGYPHPNAFVQLNLDIEKNSSKRSSFQQYYATVFFDPVQGSKNQKNLQLMIFLSGKIAEFFICSAENKTLLSSQISSAQFSIQKNKENFTFKNPLLFEKPFSFFSKKFDIFESSIQKISRFDKKVQKSAFSLEQKEKVVPMNSSEEGDFEVSTDKKKTFLSSKVQSKIESCHLQEFPSFFKKDFYWTVYGNDENWRFATPFLNSLIQKRFLFTKNLLLSKMLFFENMDQRRKPPNPPASSILISSKKYENFKRTETDFFQKAHFSIHEKIQMHQKQRFLKQLYNIPVQTYFRSELRKNHKTLFSSSFQEFAYLDSFVQRSSSSHSYYIKYIQVRHRFSNVNQWWNGMFPEHTREMTYLSDVDWRTMFVSSPAHSQQNLEQTNQLDAHVKKGDKQMKTFEFLMDFPDAEQYYNPRNRRWFFKSNRNSQSTEKAVMNSTFWSIFEKDLQYEIFSHFLMESFYQSFSYFEKKREMLDFFAFHLLSKGFLKEIDFLTTFSRF